MAAEQQWSIAPYFIVGDVVASANHYRDVLGFEYERFWGDPPASCMVRRAGIIIMLSQVEPSVPPQPNSRIDPEGQAWDAYIWVSDADALHAEFQQRGANIARAVCDQPYGCRDFDVRDLDGYLLCFGHPTG